MSGVRHIPVRGGTRVRDVRVAPEHACARTGRDARSRAAAVPVATGPASGLVEHASGGHLVIRTAGRSGILAENAPCVGIAPPDRGMDAPVALRVPRDAGSAVHPYDDASSVAVLTPDPPDGRP
ncbi:hypothetical protein D9753_01325 [Streptomyces dangxiongensis]|uniref:Uncharacterized protein n=1 Tax=Streptomyces dangxiongensis TaxID=1442032 RepID=A0A3G2JDJ8_9ACTN|nr:hypothetical protein [Streptomyces dangxiongensis]AYN37827.1 hypothetical protein D9753_01325 [Streptomyces dangxiongensis]